MHIFIRKRFVSTIHFQIIVEVLLGQGKIIDALRLAKSLPRGDATLSARKYLEAAIKGDPLVFYSVYSFFQQRNVRLRGSPDFLKSNFTAI